MELIKAPHAYSECPRPWIFLAGSIEMGKAVDWQIEIVSCLQNQRGTILNPRRDDWDSSWVQSISNAPFREQVEWELGAMEAADRILLYLAPGTRSPISLLELGLFKGPKLVVCCPEGFWRKGNVDIACARYGIQEVVGLADLAESAIAGKKAEEAGKAMEILEDHDDGKDEA